MECPHKKWKIDSHNIGVCTNPDCGEVRQFPWDGKGEVIVLKKGNPISDETDNSAKEEHMGTNIRERHRYYEDNKETIIADLLSIGRVATRKKWKIPAGATLPGLEKRWLSPEQRSIIKPHGPPDTSNLTTPTVQAKGKLPLFPEFSSTWDVSVQTKWLEIYERIVNETTTRGTSPVSSG